MISLLLLNERNQLDIDGYIGKYKHHQVKQVGKAKHLKIELMLT